MSTNPVVYESSSQLKHPRRIAQRLVRNVRASRELATRLFLRNLTAQYRQSILGYAWIILPAVVTTLIWTYLNSTEIISIETTRIPYPLHVLVGTLLWQSFVDALNMPLQQLNKARITIARVAFAHEALLIAGLAELLFNLFVRLILVVALLFFFDVALTQWMVVAPLGLLALVLFGMALGLVLLPFGLLYHDVQRGIGIVTSFWFFVTPIVYPLPTSGIGLLISRFNPVTPLLVATRGWLTGANEIAPVRFGIVGLLTMVLLIGGWVFYDVARPHLIERMSA